MRRTTATTDYLKECMGTALLELILSCNTGAGHNSCAQAVQEAYHSRGEICNITDSLQFISEKASTFISNWHTRIYRHAPRLFDAGYQRAESHEDIFCEGNIA